MEDGHALQNAKDITDELSQFFESAFIPETFDHIA